MLMNDGPKVIDFISGAGALNYGHNNHRIRAAIAEYLASDAVIHGLDIATPAKLESMEAFRFAILHKRGLQYTLQFTGPTGTNAVEAALKLSRKVTGRQNVISFTRGYHGLNLETMAASDSRFSRRAGNVSLAGATIIPYDGYLGPAVDTADYLRRLLDETSGVDAPAAVLVETVQEEGGMNVAGEEWLQWVQAISKDADALLIVGIREGIDARAIGAIDQVVKFLPALTIDRETLYQDLDIFEVSLPEALTESGLDLADA